ncbi:hypothetical protein NAPIS_ORF00344 [Vairimorpha apis BRL 01]|uniref:Uncharacterized protein n=1 Tax=Vairimorpha apis BRL 01 TaxID=1037528 RepID=T0LCQ2_9MICR|nr:hypothetical protein NAPIS_ORF00344 [Vairimorpha apis BRL 01]
MCTNKTERLKYLHESVNTYLLNPVEYNRYNAYLLYQDIALLQQNNKDKQFYFIKAGDMALSCNKENLAATAYEKACNISDDINLKIDLSYKMIECYNDSSWKFHRQQVQKQLAFLLCRNCEYEKAALLFLELGTNFYKFVGGICYFLGGIESDLDVSGDEGCVYECLNKDMSEVKVCLEKYLDNHVVESEVRMLFEKVLCGSSPENDIL